MEDYTAAAAKESCVPLETPIKNVVLAQAYVPIQRRCELFSADTSLAKGTIFPPLWDNYKRGRNGVYDYE